MISSDRYGFRLVVEPKGGAASVFDVHPATSSLHVKTQRKSDEVYYKTTFSADLKFCGDEAEIIYNESLTTLFKVCLVDDGGTFVAGAVFHITDGKIDRDRRYFEVSLDGKDKYELFEQKLKDEYNLIDIVQEEKTDLRYVVRPNCQTFIFSDVEKKLVNCLSSGDTSEDETDVNDDNSVIVDKRKFSSCYGFAAIDDMGVVYSTKTTLPLMNNRDAIVASSMYGDEIKLCLDTHSGNNLYWFEMWFRGDAQATYRYPSDGSSYLTLGALLATHTIRFGLTTFKTRVWRHCFRLLSALWTQGATKADGDDTLAGGYTYICRFPRKNSAHNGEVYTNYPKLVISEELSDTDNGYKYCSAKGKWYAPPTEDGYAPIDTGSWTNGVSLWYQKDQSVIMNEFSKYYSYPIQKSDFFTLYGMIKALVAKVDDTIVFNDDNAHSEFLFGFVNPVTKKFQGRYYVTQKSNILNYTHDTNRDAWKAPCTLERVFTMLRNALNCYWDIYADANGTRHLRIEHVSFYQKGKTYGSKLFNKIDLRARYDAMSGKPYALMSNNYEYDIDGCDTRFEFSWMDKQTGVFDGSPLVIPEDACVFTKENTNKREVDWFSSDIDFLIAVPEECSSDGFVIVATDPNTEIARVKEIACGVVSGKDVQNYRLAYDYLIPNFFPYDIASSVVEIEGQNKRIRVPNQRKCRKNKVFYSAKDIGDVDEGMIIVTDVGEGTIYSLDLDLTSNKYEFELRYDI